MHSLQALMLMEHKSTYFDTLPALLVLSARNMECSVRHTSRTSILLRVKTLDENNFIWAEIRLVEPSEASISHRCMKKGRTERLTGEQGHALQHTSRPCGWDR